MIPWWKGAVIYQIYPRSFRDTNGDGAGDLKGVLQGLDHIAALGCDGVWLSPFFTSPMADFGYDVANFCNVDPAFGTMSNFDAIVARAHQLGLRIIIDQVYSHTSDQHPWFGESCTSSNNDKANWYVWANAKPAGAPPNNWISVFGGPAWQWDDKRGQYYLHNFLKEQPDLNFHEPAVQDAILDVARFWLNRGVDGFRLDVINYCTHDAALRDNPPAAARAKPHQDFFAQRHLYSCSQPENFEFIEKLRTLADHYGDICLLGEIFDDDPLACQVEYTNGPNRLHTAYSFHLLEAKAANADLFAKALRAWKDVEGWPSWSLGNHDVERFPSRFFGSGATHQKTKLLLAILLCLRGTAFIYQGEELGLPQAHVPPARLRDPHSKRNLKRAGRDGARTPYPWQSLRKHAGFSTADETWLPVDPRHTALALDRQRDDPSSVYHFVKTMIALRNTWPALRDGDAEVLSAPAKILMFERVAKGGRAKVLCAFNLSEKAATAPAPQNGVLIESGLGGGLRDGVLELPGFSGALVACA